ncbi:hypothetical protein DL96DRAFT_710125 [Flagelloscypha sp. PMI_526]|nr:hypothetical protein DL96DRAFT_710125 [Flagelloscypha sp. PMI_526]
MHHQSIPFFLFNHTYESLSELETDDRELSVPSVLTNFLSTFTTEKPTWNELRFLQLIGEVRSFSLIEFDSLNQTISFHPLVQLWARHHSCAIDGAIRVTQTILALATPTGDGMTDYPTRKSLLLHFRDSLESGCQLHHSYLWPAGKTFRNNGLYAEAASVLEQSLKAKQCTFGPEHPDTLKSMNNLAHSYSDLARHTEASEAQRRGYGTASTHTWFRASGHVDKHEQPC